MAHPSAHRFSAPILLAVGLISISGLAVSGVSAGRSAKAKTTGGDTADARADSSRFGELPLHFVANEWKLGEATRYVVSGGDKSIYFSSLGVTYALWGFPDQPHVRPARLDEGPAPVGWGVRLEFLGGRRATPVATEQTETIVSYFKGPRAQWKPGLPTYREIVYRELWPGIDLVYRAEGRRLKYHFVVRAGADPSDIRLAYRGARTSVTSRGSLRVSTPVGGFEDEAPWAAQADGANVDVRFDTSIQTDSDVRTVGFRLGDYDRNQELLIDPAVVVYSGFLGGAGMDAAYDVAVDAVGAAYVAGFTMSAEDSFPESVGPDLAYNLARDAFVAKVRPDGTGLVYAGYIGGAADDEGRAIAVDDDGSAYVVGATASAENDFPVIGGPDLTHNGENDAFIAKVDPTGTNLTYSGYLGGSGDDLGYDIALDEAQAAYVTGTTLSADGSFPAAVGPSLQFGGASDAFIAKVAPDGSALAYSGFVGGDGFDRGMGVAVGETGEAYLTGETSSTEATFPVVVGPDLTFNGAADTLDAFVVKVAADGSALEYAGYIGGAGADSGYSIAVDPTGAAYVVGKTASDEASFPTAVGPDLSFHGSEDAFVAKVAADGSGLSASGYLGGSGMDGATSVALGPLGLIFVTGYTASADFPVVSALDDSLNGMTDVFTTALSPTAEATLYSSYLGGAQADAGRGIAVDGEGAVYLAGETMSAEGDFPTVAGPDLTANGASDGYVAKLSLGIPFFTADAVVNGASFSSGPIAPGEILSIFGIGLAVVGPGGIPPEGLGAALGPDGKLLTERGGTKVLFDGEAAPLYFVGERQINVQAPYSIDGKDSVTVEIMTLDRMTPPVEVEVAESAPGLFTTTPGGRKVIAVNPDGSLNSADNPASAGDVLLFFATGEGQTDPPGETGALAEAPLPTPVLPVELMIGGMEANLLFAGSAPNFSGLMQLNGEVPDLPPLAASSPEGLDGVDQTTTTTTSVILTVGEASSQSTEIYVNLDQQPPEVGPVAVDDEISTPEDVAVTINVLLNDSHPEGQMLTVVFVGESTRGGTQLNPDGTITFTPEANFRGVATFRYVVEDTEGRQDFASVNVRVLGADDPPNARDDTATTIEQTPVTVSPLANDSDPDGDSIELAGVGATTGGTAEANGNGTVTFTPADDFVGVATVIYTIRDSTGRTASATISITVTDDGTLPIANDDMGSVFEDDTLGLDVLSNDVNNEEGPLAIVEVSDPPNGSVVINNDSTLTYTPDPNFNGMDMFTYTIVDADSPGSDERSTGKVTIDVRVKTDLVIEKTLISGSFTAGTTVEYQVKVTNNGPSDAANTIVTDTLPADLTFVAVGSSGDCSGAGQLVTCGPVTIAENTMQVFVILAAIAPGATGPRTNMATVDQADDQNAPKSASVMNTIELQSDLAITKTNGTATVIAGQQTTYTITVTNNGPSDAIGASVSDTFPAVLQNPSWTCVASAGSACSAGPITNPIADVVNVLAGGTLTYTLVGTIPPDATGTVVNTATVAPPAGTTDPNAANDSSTDSDPIDSEADLTVTKSDDVDPVVAGNQLIYTVTVMNNGPSDAQGVVATESLPADVTLVSTSGCPEDPGGVPTCTLGAINAGDSAQYTVTVTVNPNAPASIDNTVSVASTTTLINTGDDSVTETTMVQREADLSILKDDGLGSVAAGAMLTYTITASNAGPSDVVGATISDSIPVELLSLSLVSCTPVGAGSACDPGSPLSGNTFAATVDIAAGGSVAYQIQGTVDPAASPGQLSNTAAIAAPAGVTDPNAANDSNTDLTTITQEADLSISKTNTTTPVVAGQQASFDIVVTNNGPSNVAGATVADSFAAALSNVAWTCMASGAASACTNANGTGNISEMVDIGAGGSVTFSVTGDLAAGASGALDNTASVTNPVTETMPGDESSMTSEPIQAQADLVITKSDSVDPIVPGNNLIYTVTVMNNGPSDATDVVVTDTLPADVTLVSTTGCAEDPAGAPTCTLGTIASGASAMYTIEVTVDSSAFGSISNTATVSSTTTTLISPTADDSATETTGITAQLDLSITKTDGVTTVNLGEMLTYTITASNAGPTDVIGATIADTLPTELISLSLTGCTPLGGAVCDPGAPLSGNSFNATVDIPAGDSIIYTIQGTVNPAITPTTLSNTAAVSAPAGYTDTNGANNMATDNDTVIAVSADVGVTKTTVGSVVAGAVTQFNIVVTNAGPSNATGVAVADTFSTDLSGVTWTCTPAGAASSCANAAGMGDISETVDVGAGETVTFAVQGTLNAAATGSLGNTVTVMAPMGIDPNAANNSSTTSDPITFSVTLTAVKALVGTLQSGMMGEYTITITHASGSSNANNVVVTDVLDPRLTFLPPPDSSAGCSNVGQTVTCNVGTIPVGGMSVVSIKVMVQ